MSNTDKLAKAIADMGFSRENYSEEVDAANWVLQALDPADEGANGAVTGIPDHSDQPSTVISWRQIDSIAPTSDLALTANDTWDCDLLLFEGPYVLGAYQMRNSGDATKHHEGWILNRQFNFGPTADGGPGPYLSRDAQGNIQVVNDSTNYQQNVASYRPSHCSMTGTFNGASLTDQGMLVASQIPNQWAKRDYGNTLLAALPTSGSTRMISSATALAEYSVGTNSEPGLDPAFHQSTICPTFQTVLQSTPASRSWRAKDGFYMPLRFQDQNLCYQPTEDQGAIAAVVHPWDLDNSSLAAGHASTTLPPRYIPTDDSTDGSPCVGVISRRMRFGAVSWTGLEKTSSFSITSRFGYELLTPIGSPWSANATASCRPSDRAVEAYFRLRHDLADVFPSSYNKNALLSKALDTVVPMVFGALPGGAQKAVQKGAGAVSRLAKPGSKVGKAAGAVSTRIPNKNGDAPQKGGRPRLLGKSKAE